MVAAVVINEVVNVSTWSRAWVAARIIGLACLVLWLVTAVLAHRQVWSLRGGGEETVDYSSDAILSRADALDAVVERLVTHEEYVVANTNACFLVLRREAHKMQFSVVPSRFRNGTLRGTRPEYAG